MASWSEIKRWMRALLGLGPAAPGGEGLQPIRPRVLLISYDPRIAAEGSRRLSEVLGWGDVDRLCADFCADLQQCSDGVVDYQIVERLEVDVWPLKVDRFRYDEAAYLHCWRRRNGWHQPDNVDYAAVIADFDLLGRVESGQIDEVWLFAFPYAGMYESIMVGPGAFWCNSPPLPYTGRISRRFVIMGFNYERDVGAMLESFGHRVESHLTHAWQRRTGGENLWERFILYDKIAPGRANCGSMHYAPNSVVDYDWGNPTKVLSHCDDWLFFPHSQGLVREVDCRAWGGGDMRAHHRWWFRHLPKAAGFTQGIANNWWLYGVDPNAVA